MRSVIYCFLGVVILTACRKDQVNAPEDFNVTTDGLAFQQGDSVTFNLFGNPGAIVFFSGETGKQYENRARTSAPGVAKLVFQTSMQQGPVPPKPCLDSLQLMISTNLQGYDAAHIQQATWTNISDRNTKWPKSLATSFTTSDSIDLSDFNSAEKVNIAFHVLNKKTGVTAQRKWVIQNLTLYNNQPEGVSAPLFTNFANTAWVQADLSENNRPDSGINAWNVGTWNVSAADSIRNSNGITIRTAYPITFNPGTDVNNEDNDAWLITTAVDLKAIKPDIGTVVKTEISLHSATYKYVFKKAGTYTVTFVGTNNNLDDSKSQIRQLTLKILP